MTYLFHRFDQLVVAINHDMIVTAILFIQTLRAAADQYLTILEHGDAMANSIDLRHRVRGEHNRALCSEKIVYGAIDNSARHRVHVTGGLIH